MQDVRIKWNDSWYECKFSQRNSTLLIDSKGKKKKKE